MAEDSWGTRERLEAWLKGCRVRGELGTDCCRIDFELVKEALTEIDRLLAQIESMRTGLDDALDKVRRRL